MPAKRPDELDTRIPLSTDWMIVTPTGGPAYKCEVSALPAGGGGTQSVNTQTGTTYTLISTDAQKLVTFGNAAATTVTIPANASVAFPIGTGIDVLQLGAGTLTFSPASGVTLNGTPGLRTRIQYSGGTLLKVGTDTWVIVGDTMI